MADLRERILDAAVHLLATEGVGALSMREVARRAEVSHQAPYHHFADREAILAAIAEQGFVRLRAALHAEQQPSPADRLAARGQAYVRFAISHPAHFRLMFRPELVEISKHPSLLAAAASALVELDETVAACVDAKLVKPSERADLLALAWSSVHGVALLTLDGPQSAIGEDAATRVTDLVRRLISR